MAEITSGDVTVMVLNSDEAAALSTALEDWYNTASENISDGYDPHGFTRRTGETLWSVADALGVEVSG